MARIEITRRELLKGLIGATILVAMGPLASLGSREIAFKLHNVEILPDQFHYGYMLRGLAIPEDKRIGACYFACAIEDKSDKTIFMAIKNAKEMVKVHLESKVRNGRM